MIEDKDLPILFIIFNRPQIALKSFDAIKRFRPKRLFIASDGPRETYIGEKEVVEHTRALILEQIDWPCEVKTKFQETNLGCGKGVFTAINWFFMHVDSGIILEDDCIAEQSFFKYAALMLDQFKDDERIGMIAGSNPINCKTSKTSIILSKYKSCWGWGTWKRAWLNMDINMSWRNTPAKEAIIANCGYKGRDYNIWKYKLKCIDKGYVSAWDWQWYFSLAAQNQLCIYPKYNQISNIGNGTEATHTSFAQITIPSKPLEFPLNCPKYIVPNLIFDKCFYEMSTTMQARISRILPHSWKKNIKKFISICRK